MDFRAGKVACVLVVVLGTGLTFRWIGRRRKRSKFARARSLKQKERRAAMEEMEKRANASQMDSSVASYITGLHITKLLELLRTGELTAVQTLTAYQLKAIEVNKKTNCIVEPILEAEEWAKELDLSKHRGPLHGLPISVKDCVAVKGYDCTVGCAQWIHQPFEEDSVIIQVLKKQGAIPFVKTNVPQAIMSWETTNPIFGLTVNPHDPQRTAGGSSGGEGALIAGGGSPCGIGSDIGGSIRIPGALCGVPGFKPTALRISTKGRREILSACTISDSWGPLAQSTDGLIAFMRAVLVPEMYDLDPTTPVMPFRNEVVEDRRPLRIGYSFFSGLFEVVPAALRAVEEAKRILEAQGHELFHWDGRIDESYGNLWNQCIMADGQKEMFDILEFDDVDDAMSRTKATASIPRIVRKMAAALLGPFNSTVSNRLKASCGEDSVSDLWELNRKLKNFRTSMIERWREQRMDAIICPAFDCPAVSAGLPRKLPELSSYFETLNVLDFPAGSVPVTLVSAEDALEMENNYPTLSDPTHLHKIMKKDLKGVTGLPMSVQVATLPWQDELCLRVMKELENGVKLPPQLNPITKVY